MDSLGDGFRAAIHPTFGYQLKPGQRVGWVEAIAETHHVASSSLNNNWDGLKRVLFEFTGDSAWV